MVKAPFLAPMLGGGAEYITILHRRPKIFNAGCLLVGAAKRVQKSDS
jgi:hypothetical protein